MTQDQHKLEPCPFCGSEPHGVFGPTEEGRYWVECHGPDDNTCCGDWHYTSDASNYMEARAEVVAAWNRRAHLQQRPLPVREGSITAFELAKAAGTKIAPILRALNAGGGDFTVNQALTLKHIGRALASPSLPVREEPTDEQALAFHRALTDGAIGHHELEDIKTGLRAALASSPSVQNMGEGETGKDGVEASRPVKHEDTTAYIVLYEDGVVATIYTGPAAYKLKAGRYPLVLAAGVKGRTLYDQRTAIDDACRDAAPQLYAALRNLLDAVRERRDNCGIESVVIADATAALATAGVLGTLAGQRQEGGE